MQPNVMLAWFAPSPVLALLDATAEWLTSAVVGTSIDGVLFALPVWLLCRFAPGLSGAARTWLWWCVSLKLLLGALAIPGLSVAVLPGSWSAVLPSSHAERSVAPAGPPSTPHPNPLPAPRPLHTQGASGEASTDVASGWQLTARLLAITWLVGLVVHVSRLVRHVRRLRTIIGRAVAAGPDLVAEHDELASDLALRRAPRLLESSEIEVPQVVGVWRPTVLLPPGMASRLSTRERAMVLCHELMHVRRGDLALGWFPALAERLLVFHPLAWLAAREYALAREAACDQAVLRTLDTEAHDYGRLLVRLGVSASAAGVAAAGASPSLHLLRRRLHMLQQSASHPSRAVWLATIGAALVVALIPLRLVAEAPRTAAHPLVAAGPVAADRSEATRAPERAESEKLAAWIYVRAEGDITMNGDTRDIASAKRARRSGSGPVFFFRRDGREYVMDDAASLQAIDTILAPMMELGRQQGELGEKQGALGEQQGRLGEKQGALGERQGRLGAQQAELSAKLVSAQAHEISIAGEHARRSDQELKAAEKEFERQMRELSERQAALGEEQAELGRQQAELGSRQGELGEEQGRLGELQRVASEEAEHQLRDLVDRALAEGRAREIR